MVSRRSRTLPASLMLSVTLHSVTLLLLLVWRLTPMSDSAPEIEIEYVEAVPGQPDQQLPSNDTEPGDGFDPAPLQLGELEFDINKVRSRVAMLFPFLTADMMFLESVTSELAAKRERLVNPYATDGGADDNSPPLELSDDELQEAIDGAWSRRERWKTFAGIVKYLDTHNPHEGRAPDLVRAYLDQNILQPYCDGATRDPRYWAMMENAADHADFVDYIRSYTRRHPSSRTTTELLLLLDELAQGSRDVLIMVIETHPEEHLAMTRNLAPEGYEVAVEIKERYGRWLFDRSLNKGGVRRHYNDLRLRILRTIVETTPHGYRRADAQFLAGQVLYEMGRLDEAVRIWRSIAPIQGDAYFRTYAEMLDVLGDGPPDFQAVARVLRREYGRWRVFSIDRLRSFGHWCDTF